MSSLFTPLRLRSITLKNRIFLSPMCQYSCLDGIPTDWHLVHYGSRAVGGAAVVVVEATAVSPEGRISPADCGLWNDLQMEAFCAIARFITAQGAIPAIQLGHAGRKASVQPPWLGGATVVESAGGWQPLAPSPVPFTTAAAVPAELTTTEIGRISDNFVAAAYRARSAGFKIVEIHMAHGYLLHSFLSPLTNLRRDEYGGDLTNRLRLPLQVAAQVRTAWPDELPVLVRLSVTDWVEGGWDLHQSLALCRQLQSSGIDLIDCSSAGLIADAVIPVAPGFQVPFATAIREQIGILTGAVGLITDAEQADQIIATGQADVVLLGRELLRNPYWPLQAAQQLKVVQPWPSQYERARL